MQKVLWEQGRTQEIHTHPIKQAGRLSVWIIPVIKKLKKKRGKVLTIGGESGILSKLFRTAAQNWKEVEVRPVVAQEKHLTARAKSDIIFRLFGRREPSGEPEAWKRRKNFLTGGGKSDIIRKLLITNGMFRKLRKNLKKVLDKRKTVCYNSNVPLRAVCTL